MLQRLDRKNSISWEMQLETTRHYIVFFILNFLLKASCAEEKYGTIHLVWTNLLWGYFSCNQLKIRDLFIQNVLSDFLWVFCFVYTATLRVIPLHGRNAWNLWLGSCEIYVKISGMEKLCVTGDVVVKVNAIFYSQIIDWKKIVTVFF